MMRFVTKMSKCMAVVLKSLKCQKQNFTGEQNTEFGKVVIPTRKSVKKVKQ